MTDKKCKNCMSYRDETFTTTGIGIAYCDTKVSKRYGMQDGSIETVVYADGTCRYFKEKQQYEQLSLF